MIFKNEAARSFLSHAAEAAAAEGGGGGGGGGGVADVNLRNVLALYNIVVQSV